MDYDWWTRIQIYWQGGLQGLTSDISLNIFFISQENLYLSKKKQ